MSACELCGAESSNARADVTLCGTCDGAIEDPSTVEAKHWFCLRDSMWSDRGPVKIMVYQVLKRLGEQPLARELLDQIYLDEDQQKIADAGLGSESSDDGSIRIVDSNGTLLAEGDTVTLIKDLEVKGAGFTAKRGTTVKGINLTDDARYVEGKVNGVRIVLVAAYLKKA